MSITCSLRGNTDFLLNLFDFAAEGELIDLPRRGVAAEVCCLFVVCRP